MIPFLYL